MHFISKRRPQVVRSSVNVSESIALRHSFTVVHNVFSDNSSIYNGVYNKSSSINDDDNIRTLSWKVFKEFNYFISCRIQI